MVAGSSVARAAGSRRKTGMRNTPISLTAVSKALISRVLHSAGVKQRRRAWSGEGKKRWHRRTGA